MLENPELEEDEEAIRDSFPDEHLMGIFVKEPEKDPWYVDYANFLVSRVMPRDLTYHLRKMFLSDLKHYIWDEPYLFKSCPYGIVRRCVFGKEIQEILEHCHKGLTGGHYRANITTRKIFESGFYWPTIFKGAKKHVRECDACQRAKNISSRNQMLLTNTIVSELFDTWGIDFMGPFPSSRNNKYILVAVDYADKLDDALCAFRTAYKSPIKSTSFRIVYGKACHLPIEMEHKAYWALRNVNLNLDVAGRNRITDKEFQEGEEVLVFNSRLKLFPSKLKTRWYGPYTVSKVFSYETVEVCGKYGIHFKVNGHRIKKYYGGGV
ncbi:reverse transcriptase domain-containing protein [Tanacetum coccineum]|uniref:Reverse transcriptase domain-containing protein n=1 Tax=Tanacetum coccineum TaxID=301880 RepID=A0ABQ5GDS9_9ASTR